MYPDVTKFKRILFSQQYPDKESNKSCNITEPRKTNNTYKRHMETKPPHTTQNGKIKNLLTNKNFTFEVPISRLQKANAIKW